MSQLCAQRGAQGAQRVPRVGHLAPWDLSHSTIPPILCEEGFHNHEVGSSLQETKSTGGVNVESCCPLGHLPLIIASLGFEKRDQR